MHGARNNTQTMGPAVCSAAGSMAVCRVARTLLRPCLGLLVLVLILICGRA